MAGVGASPRGASAVPVALFPNAISQAGLTCLKAEAR
jgi:hypothetical protein